MGLDSNPLNLDAKTVEQLLNCLPYPFLISEIRIGRVETVFLNQKFLDEVGYTLDQIATRDAWFALAYPDLNYRKEVAEIWGKYYEEAIKNGRGDVSMKVKVLTVKHGERWYEVKSTVIERWSFIAFVDIHEEVLLREELQKVNQDKNQILSVLAHDIRSPILNIHGISNLALRSIITPQEFSDVVQNLHEKTKELLEFIDTTLVWTRTNFDSMQVNITKIDLAEIVESILKIYEDVIHQKQISINVSLTKEINYSDREIIKIVVRNLVSNAIKFTPVSGSINIVSEKNKGEFTIKIKDSGEGITPETLSKLLAEIHHSTIGTKGEDGLGLGLKLCRQLLDKINARLEIESEFGKGTLMKIVVPVKKG
jgi:signal transduction histidine kinase